MHKTSKRGLLIGCGFFAENHLNAWAEIEGADIVAVCDLNEDRARDIAEKFSVSTFHDDARQAFESGVYDFVDIATTVGSHRALVELSAPHVKTIICQKPFAETIADATEMVDATRRQNVDLIIHENFRWQKAFRTMKKLVNEERLGKLNFARFSFRHGYDNYKNQPYLAEIERFTIMDVGLHLFDLARHFLGEVETLNCKTQRLNPAVRGEDAFTVLLGHENGATSVCDCSFFSKIDPQPFPQTVAWIEGNEATLELDRDYRLTLHEDDRHTLIDTEPETPAWGEKPWHGVQESVLNFQLHALEVMRGNAAPQPSGSDNINTLALAFAAYESAEHDTTIHMHNWRET